MDALADLIYFAAGRFYEMGIDGGRVFEEVHRCNMLKKQGELAKRPGSKGHDAVKPEGWTPPDHSWIIEAPRYHQGMTMAHAGTGKRVGVITDIVWTPVGYRYRVELVKRDYGKGEAKPHCMYEESSIIEDKS